VLIRVLATRLDTGAAGAGNVIKRNVFANWRTQRRPTRY
jgi:hypothetical protein